MLYGDRFPLKPKGAVYECYIRPAMLYGSEAWCLRESEMIILGWTERSMLRAMCGVQLIKSYADLMFTLGLKETIDQLAMANNVCWHGHVLWREDDHALYFEVEGQRMKGRPKRTWKKQVDEESMNVGLRMRDALCRSKCGVGVNKITAGLR